MSTQRARRPDLKTVAKIAADVARQHDHRLRVMGVSPGEGEGNYTEIMIVVQGCRQTPCAISLGVLRDVPEGELRATIAGKLRDHFAGPH